jgi:hypothetical protein
MNLKLPRVNHFLEKSQYMKVKIEVVRVIN